MALPYTSILAGASGQSSGYSISNSARFVSGNSAYLYRTPGGVGTSRRIFTISTWMKLSDVSTYQGEILHVGSASGTSNTDWLQFYYDANKFKVGGWSSEYLATTAVYRDPGAWLHVVLAVDTTQATAANRMRLYVNGSEVTAFTTASYPTLNQDTPVNNTQQHNIGARTGGSVFYNGYLSNYYLIDGQQLTPSSFGQTNTSGVWVPKAYSGTYGTNGSLMAFLNSAALGTDTSGNGNTFTSSGLVAGDQFSDTPTLNWATLNPLLKYANVTASEGNLLATPSGTNVQFIGATIALPTTGKWCWWAQRASGTSVNLGIGDATAAVGLDVNKGTNLIFDVNTGAFSKYYSGASQTAPSSFSAPGASLMRFEYDAVNDDLYIYDDNVLAKTVTGTGIRANAVGPIFPIFGPYASTPATVRANFGAAGLPETPTTGYVALNSTNLPAPAIKDGSAHFQTALHTGTGSAITINQSGNSTFTSDFVWTKGRSGATDHILSNIISGTGKYLVSNTTAAEATDAQALTAFGAGSISYGTLAAANTNAATYVDWMWKGGAGVSNTNGSITSTVSANTTAGISVVTYTGTGSIATVGHGLGVAPGFIVVFRRDTAGFSHRVYHSSLGATAGGELFLNSTAAATTNSANWNNTNPTSTVFTVGTSTGMNASGGTYVAICFAPIASFSAISAYTGNGSADGPFIYTGFKPAWVMWKNASAAATSWLIKDTSRDTYNVMTTRLFAENANADDVNTSNDLIDYVSNGFKIRSISGAQTNGSGNTIIYAAFASNPFGGSGAAPATAR